MIGFSQVSTADISGSLNIPSLVAPPAQSPLRRGAMSSELRRQALLAGSGDPRVMANGYSGAARTNLNRDWLTTHYSADSAIAAAWDEITKRARDLKRNEPWAAQAVERIVQNVIGDEGFGAESEIEIDGELDETANSEIDEWYLRWAEEADAEGECHLAELQQLAMSECVEVGQCFLLAVQVKDSNRTIPLAYQLLESEQLNTTLDWPNSPGNIPEGNRIRRGIEFDRQHRRVAYHFWTEHPYDYQVVATDTIRVPASRVLHFFRKTRPSQTQGITWLAPVLQSLRDLGSYIGDEMSAAEIGAKFAVVIKRAIGAGTPLALGLGTDGDACDSDLGDSQFEDIGLNIANIGANDSVEQVQANRPNSQADPWIKLMQASIANGVGMTYLGLTGDVSQASFSSSRFARLLDKTFWKTNQGHFGRKVVVPMRRAAVRQFAAFGLLRSVSSTQFAAQPARWLATRLLPHGWEEIQVKEEVEAAIRRIQAGLSTLQTECAMFGRNWRRVLKQRSREIAYSGSLDLDLSVDYPGPVQGTTPDPPGPPGSEPIQPADSTQGGKGNG
jgi:lambda family phage portal protein